MLASRLPEALLVRLDTEAVAFALYVGGHGLLGALFGAVTGPADRHALLRRLRPLWLALLVGVVDLALLLPIWNHQSLPFGPGIGLMAVGIVMAAGIGAVIAIPIRALPSSATSRLAALLPAIILGTGLVTLVRAAREPGSDTVQMIDEPVRVETGVKVAIVALDGLDGYLVDAGIAEGRLPNLAALQERGVRGNLRSIRPPKSPVVWTSVATGMLPSVHGIADFVVQRDGERIPVTSNLRRVPALWNLAPTLGFTNTFVNWYVTWPAEPTLGVMISDRVDLPELERRVYPEELTAVVDSIRAAVDSNADRDVARFTRQADNFDEWRGDQWGQIRRSLRILDDVVRHDLVTLEIARAMVERHQSDVTALYFRGNDNTQHLFWKYRLANRGERIADALYGELDDKNVQRLAPVVERYYDFADKMLGETLAMLDPETAVLVVSDHGFLTNNERSRWFRINRLLEIGGFATLLRGEGGQADSAASLVWDPVEPTIDARRVLRAGGAAQDAGDELRKAHEFLLGLHTDADDRLFVSTALGADEDGPRLAVIFKKELEGKRLLGEGIDWPLSEFRIPEGHSGDHRMNGFLLAAGGPFRKGVRVQGSRAIDLAPTILHLVGAPVARDMEGVVLVDLLEPAWRTEHPVRAVVTYGTMGDDDHAAISTEADDRIREELEALGYLR